MSIIAWLLSFGVLAFVAGILGKRLGKGWLGILIDNRGRYSLTHFQVVLWTLVILSSLIGAIVARNFDVADLDFPPQLLGLMGISAGSAAFATGVKSAKDNGGTAKVAGAWTNLKSGDPRIFVSRHFSQMWLEEEGENHDKVISITKFQNFVFTIVILVVYVTSAVKQGGLPVFPENIVWMIGVSHAGYVGAKVPDKK